MLCVTGPFNDSSLDYLLVADYNQQYVYQLQPSTGELRSFFTDRLHTVAMALDPSRRIVYRACVRGFYDLRYVIGKSSFDSNDISYIYFAPSGIASRLFRLHYMNLCVPCTKVFFTFIFIGMTLCIVVCKIS